MIYKLKILIFLSLIVPMVTSAQHTIKGTFSPAEDYEWVLLYKVGPSESNFVTDAEIDKEGVVTIQLDSTQTKGIYRLVYAVPQEDYNFDIIYNAKEDIEFNFDSETGLKFVASIENNLLNSYTNSMAMISQSIGNFYNQQSTDSIMLKKLFKTQTDTQKEFENIAKGTIASHFIKANRPFIPETYMDVKDYVKNLKAHFFDHVDFNNKTLISSNFLVEHVLNYVFGLVSQTDDAQKIYKQNIDDVVKAMKAATPKTKKILLNILWHQLADINYEEAANYLADTYLMKLATDTNDQEMMTKLKRFKAISIGEIAPDFVISSVSSKDKPLKKLRDLNKADTYVVVFWSSLCSHCLNELPELHDYVSSCDDGKFQIIAFGLEDDKSTWEKEVKKLPEFTHVIGLGKWENPVGNLYDVSATPTYFVLDKDKRIIAKPVDYSNLLTILEARQ